MSKSKKNKAAKRPAESNAAEGAESRQHPRVPLDVLVQVRSDSIAQFRAVHAKNLSVGGMFIATSEGAGTMSESGKVAAAKAVGTQVFFQFTVKDGGTLIEGLGKIVHASPAGLGVEFVSVLEPSKSIIRALVEERLKAPAATTQSA
jgi:hypothetical protein